MRKLLLFSFWMSGLAFSSAQEADQPWQFGGYLKFLQSTSFVPQGLSPVPLPSNKVMFNDMLLHNRLNFKYFPSENFTFHLQLRNRVFWGDQVRFTLLGGGDYVKTVNEASDDFFHWSIGAQNDNGYAVHTALDRFYGEYAKGSWEFRLGRQRVNWGIATTWNPNDLFNAYNFTDFDYEERPGTDALRVKRYLGVASSVELAVSAFDEWDEATAAVLAKFNSGSYDWQLLAGVMDRYAVVGGGWAGNAGNASFKGETSWFYPLADGLEGNFALTMGMDYTLPSQAYLNGSLLFNAKGATHGGINNLSDFQLSARNLYPYRYAVMAQAGYPVSPLLNVALAVVYSPGDAHAMFLNPVVTYSVAQNWDLDLLAQFLFQKGEKYESPLQTGFIRLKWSF